MFVQIHIVAYFSVSDIAGPVSFIFICFFINIGDRNHVVIDFGGQFC